MLKANGIAGIALLVLGSLVVSAASAAEMVVVEARGIGLKQGDIVDDGAPLTLKDGEQVTLIAASGNILTLRGPYDRPPATEVADASMDVGKALDALTTRHSARNVAGVIRAGDAPVHLPSPWLVDVSHSGSACMRPGAPPVFWRASDAGGETLTIMPADRSWRAQAPWAGRIATLDAPSNFPLKDGRTYLTDFGGRPVAVTLYEVPDSLNNPRMQVAWMMEKGCLAQAEALLKTVP